MKKQASLYFKISKTNYLFLRIFIAVIIYNARIDFLPFFFFLLVKNYIEFMCNKFKYFVYEYAHIRKGVILLILRNL